MNNTTTSATERITIRHKAFKVEWIDRDGKPQTDYFRTSKEAADKAGSLHNMGLSSTVYQKKLDTVKGEYTYSHYYDLEY